MILVHQVNDIKQRKYVSFVIFKQVVDGTTFNKEGSPCVISKGMGK